MFWSHNISPCRFWLLNSYLILGYNFLQCINNMHLDVELFHSSVVWKYFVIRVNVILNLIQNNRDCGSLLRERFIFLALVDTRFVRKGMNLFACLWKCIIYYMYVLYSFWSDCYLYTFSLAIPLNVVIWFTFFSALMLLFYVSTIFMSCLNSEIHKLWNKVRKKRFVFNPCTY